MLAVNSIFYEIETREQNKHIDAFAANKHSLVSLINAQKTFQLQTLCLKVCIRCTTRLLSSGQ